MEKTFYKTIKFDRDLHTKYDPNLIDNLEIYNFSEKKFTKCEHWGWNDEGENNMPFYDFGMIADFHFDISKTETRLYFGDAPLLGFYRNNPTQLLCLHVVERKENFDYKNFINTGVFAFEKKYPSPKTMWDLANFIADYLFCRKSHLLNLKFQHQQEMCERFNKKELVNVECDDDLPF